MPKRTLAVLAVAAFGALAVPIGLPRSAAAAGPAYSSIAIKPLPIAQAGSLTTPGTNVTLCVQPLDSSLHPVLGAVVFLSIDSGLFSPTPPGGSATVGATTLTNTPVSFTTTSASCTNSSGTFGDALTVTYTSPNPAQVKGRDVIAAESDASSFDLATGLCTGPGICKAATYVFSPVALYSISSIPIAATGTLTAGQQAVFTVVALDNSTPTRHPVPQAFLDLSLTGSSAGTATGVNSFSGFAKEKIVNTPNRFGSDLNGSVQVTYTAANPLPTSGTDTITAQNLPQSPTVFLPTSYSYGSSVLFTQNPYTPVNPFRVCDTRPVQPGIAVNQCNLAGQGPILQGQARAVTVTGGGVPSTATAIVVNVTAIAPTRSTFVTLFPAGGSLPKTSNINPQAGAIVANLVEVSIGTAGQIDVFNDLGTINIALDVEGYVDSTSTSLFNPSAPARICDTRAAGPGIAANQCNVGGMHEIGAGGVLTFNIAALGASNVTAVVFNLTAIAPSAGTVLTAYPGSSPRPGVSNVNVNRSATVPNRVIVKVPAACTGAACTVNIWNSVGSVNVAVDVDGWFQSTTGAQFTGVAPARACDTRFGTSGTDGCSNPGMIAAGGSLSINIAGIDNIPLMTDLHAPVAVVLNVTAVNATSGTFVTVYPALTTRPNASDLNVPSSLPVTNLVVVQVGSNGWINLFNDLGNIDLIVDVMGFYSN
jgi:hypothetical protein